MIDDDDDDDDHDNDDDGNGYLMVSLLKFYFLLMPLITEQNLIIMINKA
jgi:hypothetical protein